MEGVPDGCVQFTGRVPHALKNPACMTVDRLDSSLDPIDLRIRSHEHGATPEHYSQLTERHQGKKKRSKVERSEGPARGGRIGRW